MSTHPHTSAHGPIMLLWTCRPHGAEQVRVSTRADIETHIVLRALRDSAFRDELIADPLATLRREYCMNIPNEMRVHVLAETGTEVYLVLPHNPFLGVSEDQLERDTGFSLEQVAALVTQSQRDTLLEGARTATVVARAWRDQAFRTAFLSDPRSALERELGLKFPDGYRFVAVEEGPRDIYIVLAHAGDEEPWVLDAGVWEEANLGASHIMAVAQSDRCAATCLCPYTYAQILTDFKCYVTCVDRERATHIYRDEGQDGP